MLGLRDVVFISPPPSHHHYPNFSLPPAPAALGVGVGIFPLLAAAAPCTTQPPNIKKISPQVEEERGSSSRACTDCGNRAKKDCRFNRCRTCCKSKGYDCVTHVKSTWVSASHRREQKVVSGDGDGGGGGGGSSGSSSFGAKRSKVLAAASSQNVKAASHASSSSPYQYHQDASFKESLPTQVQAPAAFRCMRVTAISDREAEISYQATVKVCGHVFKGFLYNQGVDEKNQYPNISELHLERSASGKNNGSSSSPIVDSSNAFAASGSGKLLRN